MPGIEIVGVVEDFSYRNIREESEQAFFPFAGGGGAAFYVRMRGQANSAFAAIRVAVQEVAPAVPVLALRTVEAQIDRTLTTERMLATLSSGFGAIALLLSVVGLYGVMSFVATARTREIGIRLALGAGRASALWLILRDALIMIAGGAAIGLPCAWALGRVVRSQLFGVDTLDGRAIFIAVAVLGVVSLAAVTRPAWRAASISPTKALRFE